MKKTLVCSVLATCVLAACVMAGNNSQPMVVKSYSSASDSAVAVLGDIHEEQKDTTLGGKAIKGTDDFVCISDTVVKSKDGKLSFPVRTDDFGVDEYVGCMDGVYVFANPCQVFFSDGRQADFYSQFINMEVNKEKMQISWQMGCEKVSMSIAQLYEIVKRGVVQPQCARTFHPTINGVESERNLMTISAYAKRIPQKVVGCFSESVARSAFEDGIQPYKGADISALVHYYGNMWKEKFQAEWQGEESYPFEVIKVYLQKAMDNARYLTTYYMGSYYYGGAHGAYHSFYTTYDKKQDKILEVSDIVKDDRLAEFREVAYKELLRLKLERTNAELHEYQGYYVCCGEGEYDCALNSAADLVLQHVAVLPQGLSLSYHPYQLGAPWEGEYHVLIPYDKIKNCLKFDYSKVEAESFDVYRLFERNL